MPSRQMEAYSDPQKLTEALCYRFYGYKRNIPGAASLFIAVQAKDAHAFFVTEMPSDATVLEDEIAEARTHKGATAFVGPVQIGDDGRGEESSTYVVTLYWANTIQSEVMRGLIGKTAPALPSDVEAQRLGEPKEYVHLQHSEIRDFHCSLSNAVRS